MRINIILNFLKATYRLHNLILVLHVLPNQGYEKMSFFVNLSGQQQKTVLPTIYVSRIDW